MTKTTITLLAAAIGLWLLVHAVDHVQRLDELDERMRIECESRSNGSHHWIIASEGNYCYYVAQ